MVYTNRWVCKKCEMISGFTSFQAYAGTIDYGAQLPFVLHNGAMFTHANLNGHGMPFYHQNVRPGRRHDNSEATLALRSPLLDEFRANKTRKWELRVCRFTCKLCHLVINFSIRTFSVM